MANIKISELNELEQVDNDDLLVIVDTSANETKKVKARNVGTGGGGSDIVIISDTQPTSEDNKIWIDTGEVQNLGSEVHIGTEVDSKIGLNILYSANLFDESTYTNGMAWNNATGFPSRATAYFNITAGKTYSISASNISRLNGGGVIVFEKSQPSASTSISSVVSFNTDGSLTFTASSGANILAIQLSIPSGNISSSNYPDIMIVEGSTPKTYAKYVSQPTININGDNVFYGNIYSTAEQIIGTYLGKPLYRRVFTGTTSTTTDNTMLTSSGNIEKIISSKGYIEQSSSVQLEIGENIYHQDSSFSSFTRVINVNNNIRFDYNHSVFSGKHYEVSVEYTKTTN